MSSNVSKNPHYGTTLPPFSTFAGCLLLTYPCLLSLTSIVIVTFLFWFVVKKILRSNEKSVIVLYFLGMFFWLILPVGEIFKSYLLKHVIVLQFLKNNLAILWVFIILFFLYMIRSSKKIKYKKRSSNSSFLTFTKRYHLLLKEHFCPHLIISFLLEAPLSSSDSYDIALKKHFTMFIKLIYYMHTPFSKEYPLNNSSIDIDFFPCL